MVDRKIILMILLLQDTKGDTNIENRLIVTVWKEEGGMTWERSIKTYTWPYVKRIASGNLLYDTGNSKPGLCDSLGGWNGEGGGREVWEGWDIYIPMTYSCWCIVIHHNIVKQLSSNWKKFFKKHKNILHPLSSTAPSHWVNDCACSSHVYLTWLLIYESDRYPLFFMAI